jgi:hypothetical protein
MTTSNSGFPFASTILSACFALCFALSAAPAHAEPADVTPQDGSPSISLAATPLYQFDSNLNKGGSVSVFRTIFDINGNIPLSETLGIGLHFSYNYADYNFSEPVTFAGVKPWDKVHNLEFGGSVGYDLTPIWSIYVYPSIQFSLEDGAGWGNAVGYGGAVSVTRDFGPNLTLGLGVAAFSQIEDVAVFPMIVVNWKITERLLLANPFRPGPAGPAGLELSYRIGDGWDAAAGAAYRSERFRLKNSGLYADGIGESNAIPAFGRISRSVGKNFNLDFYGGVMFGGKLSIDDSKGNRLTSEDYNPAPFLALAISARF